jgi:pyruvate formate lyase activating enzyme
MDEAGVLAFLETRVKFLDGVVISGGEPTMVEDLPEFIKKIKGMGYLVKLDTNGSRPGVVEDLIKRRLIDYVALDLKGDPKNYPEELAPKSVTKNVITTLNLLKSSPLSYEFRTTAVAPFVDDSSVERIASAATGEATLYLQKVRLEKVFNPEFMAKYPNQPGKEDLARYRAIASRYLPCVIR